MSPKRKADQCLTTQKKRATVQRDSEEDLTEQSQTRKSEAEERYENNIEGGGEGSVDFDKENECEKEKEDDNQHDDNGSTMGHELISTSQHNPVKTFNIDRFQVVMLINEPEAELKITGDVVLKCQMGNFNNFRKIMKNENIDGLFKKSCFGHFLELPEDPPPHFCFPSTMVYGLLKRSIKYVGDDKNIRRRGEKKVDEIWINYCGMPVCFGLQEFAIVTGLRCHRPEEPPPPLKSSKARKRKKKIDGLFDIARSGYKALDLLTYLEDKTIPEQYMEQLFLVWFAHSVLLARDVNKVIEDDLLERAEDFDKFNHHPWGYDSFYLTVQYLLLKLSSKMNSLYGFPWAFMVMDYPEEVSYPRTFKWLAAKSNTKIKEDDFFNPPNDVNPMWI
ncbi:hypothetical protein P3S67_017353 [Capsicum chacoense]